MKLKCACCFQFCLVPTRLMEKVALLNTDPAKSKEEELLRKSVSMDMMPKEMGGNNPTPPIEWELPHIGFGNLIHI